MVKERERESKVTCRRERIGHNIVVTYRDVKKTSLSIKVSR